MARTKFRYIHRERLDLAMLPALFRALDIVTTVCFLVKLFQWPVPGCSMWLKLAGPASYHLSLMLEWWGFLAGQYFYILLAGVWPTATTATKCDRTKVWRCCVCFDLSCFDWTRSGMAYYFDIFLYYQFDDIQVRHSLSSR